MVAQDGPETQLKLIETLLWEDGLPHLELHLDRLESSTGYFRFCFDRQTVAAALLSACAESLHMGQLRVRLVLARSGDVEVSVSKLEVSPVHPRVMISDVRTCSHNLLLRHKTTKRSVYDEQLKGAKDRGFDEVLFRNERGEITEGAISNVFVQFQHRLFTPPITSGVLPGVMRRKILECDVNAEERMLTVAHVRRADAIFLCSSLRGLRLVDMVASCAVAPDGLACQHDDQSILWRNSRATNSS